jgi:hypothetical protein
MPSGSLHPLREASQTRAGGSVYQRRRDDREEVGIEAEEERAPHRCCVAATPATSRPGWRRWRSRSAASRRRSSSRKPPQICVRAWAQARGRGERGRPGALLPPRLPLPPTTPQQRRAQRAHSAARPVPKSRPAPRSRPRNLLITLHYGPFPLLWPWLKHAQSRRVLPPFTLLYDTGLHETDLTLTPRSDALPERSARRVRKLGCSKRSVGLSVGAPVALR